MTIWDSTYYIRKKGLLLSLPLLFGLLVGCNDSGLDPETAEVVFGEQGDMVELPDIQKVALEAGFKGDQVKVITEFVDFRRLARYRVDMLDDGSVTGLRGLYMEATIDDNAQNNRRSLSPLRKLVLRVEHLPVTLFGTGETIDLTDDLDGNVIRVGGVKAVLDNGDILMTDAVERDVNWAEARIESVDEVKRRIVLRIKADLVNMASGSTPSRLHGLALDMLMELPY